MRTEHLSIEPYTWLAFVLLQIGCGPATSNEATVIISDSAGIEIVTNRAGTWTGGDEWRLQREPEVAIGVAEGEAPYEFFNIVGVTRLSHGEIVIADGGAGQIRFFDRNGTFIASIGRNGSGPGEFRLMRAMLRYRADSLLVYDPILARLSALGPTGGVGRLFTLSAPDDESGFPMVAAIFDDSSFLVKISRVTAPYKEVRVVYPTLPLYLYDPEGGPVRKLAEVPGRPVLEGPDAMAGAVSFTVDPSFAAYGQRFVAGWSSDYEINVFDNRGSLARIIRLTRQPTPVEPYHIDLETRRRLEEKLSVYQDMRPHTREFLSSGDRRMMANMPFPEVFPALDRIMTDPSGNLWVHDYVPIGEHYNRWRIFDSTGVYLGPVDAPPGLNVHDISEAYVLGVVKDSMDVQYVKLYRIKKRKNNP